MSWFYRLSGRFPALVIARRNLSRAKIRSGLAITAILIGVVAIGAIGAGGASFKQSQLNTIRDQGATNVYVFPGIDKAESTFDREDVLAIETTVGSAGVVATKEVDREFQPRGADQATVSVTYLEDPRALYTVADGSIPRNWRNSIVLSGAFAAEHGLGPDDRITLFDEDDETGAVTEERTYRIAAVLEETQAFGVSDAYLPIEAAPDRTYGQVRITTQSVDEAEVAASRIRERFNGRKDLVLVFELTSLIRLLKQIVNGINVFLAGLGSISLLVAGVSIANTMLMAVIKRRQEIGVLRAVGYEKTDILRILIVEALLLGAIGSVIGVLIAIGITMAANAVFLGDPLAFSPESIPYLVGAVGFGLLTSLVAGIYPAWRAANDRPVESLRG